LEACFLPTLMTYHTLINFIWYKRGYDRHSSNSRLFFCAKY
jgi:hypothetical protein